MACRTWNEKHWRQRWPHDGPPSVCSVPITGRQLRPRHHVLTLDSTTCIKTNEYGVTSAVRKVHARPVQYPLPRYGVKSPLLPIIGEHSYAKVESKWGSNLRQFLRNLKTIRVGYQMRLPHRYVRPVCCCLCIAIARQERTGVRRSLYFVQDKKWCTYYGGN